MRIYVDIDGTICSQGEGLNYSVAEPIPGMISKVNELYDAGNTIVYWTARGTITGEDWSKVTRNQLKEWGCRYHDLLFGKPAFDLYICDKAINAREL